MIEDRMYETLGAMREQLGRMDGKLDGIKNEQVRLANYTQETSRRVGRVENKQAHQDGRTASIGAIVGAVFGLIAAWLKSLI